MKILIAERRWGRPLTFGEKQLLMGLIGSRVEQNTDLRIRSAFCALCTEGFINPEGYKVTPLGRSPLYRVFMDFAERYPGLLTFTGRYTVDYGISIHTVQLALYGCSNPEAVRADFIHTFSQGAVASNFTGDPIISTWRAG